MLAFTHCTSYNVRLGGLQYELFRFNQITMISLLCPGIGRLSYIKSQNLNIPMHARITNNNRKWEASLLTTLCYESFLTFKNRLSIFLPAVITNLSYHYIHRV